MTIREITALAIRILAIYLGVNLLVGIWPFAAMFTSESVAGDADFSTQSFVIALSIMLGLGCLIVFLLVRLSGSVLENTPDRIWNIPSAISPKYLIQLLGLFFLVKGASSFPYWFAVQLKPGAVLDFSDLYLGRSFFEFFAGFILLCIPGKLSGLMNKLAGEIDN